MQAFTLPLDFLFMEEYDGNGEILRGRTRVFDKTLINSGKKGSGKSEWTNWFIQMIVDYYGQENVGVNVSYDLFSMLGEWDSSINSFSGGSIGNEFVQVVIIEDALTLVGKDTPKDIKNKMTKVFQNARHLLKYRDENDNAVGLVIFVFNVQDYFLLSDSMRRDWDFAVLRTIPKNPYHNNRLKRECPPEGIAILNKITNNMRMNVMDQSYKSNSVVDFGGGKYGHIRHNRVATNYTQKNGPYWINPQKTKENVQGVRAVSVDSSALRTTSGKKFEFLKTKEEPFPVELLEKAFLWGKDNPAPMGNGSKYKPDFHWQIANDYLVKGIATGMIAEALGVTDQMIGNGYRQGGYIAIVVQEQLGYWIEQVIPEFITDIKWNLTAEQATSDLKDDAALNAPPGVGTHGEIKTRRRKETPEDEWISTEMEAHINAGGTALCYQVVVRRNRDQQPEPIIITYRVSSIDKTIQPKEKTKTEKAASVLVSTVVSESLYADEDDDDFIL